MWLAELTDKYRAALARDRARLRSLIEQYSPH